MSSSASTHRPAPIADLPPIFGALHDAKVKSGLTFEQIAQKIDRSEWWTAGLFYGQAKPEQQDIKALAKVLDIREQYLVDALGPSFFPTRGVGEWPPKGDPVVYRLYEALLVYGHSIKHIIHEKFGDGIMSAIDFTGAVERVEPGDGSARVKITFDGKFLPYKRW